MTVSRPTRCDDRATADGTDGTFVVMPPSTNGHGGTAFKVVPGDRAANITPLDPATLAPVPDQGNGRRRSAADG